MPYVCYVDEAGCSTPLPAKNTSIQPVLVLAGLVIEQSRIPSLTINFLTLKRKYFPGKFKSSHPLDDVREEIKGSDIRSRIRKITYAAKAELKFLDEVLALLNKNDAAIFSSIWIKGVGQPFKARQIYTMSVQDSCKAYQELLNEKNDYGFIIADFRTTQLNDQVAHSIFTQKYKAKGDPYPRMLELPTFGVSNNHVGIQISDLLCSAILFPMATSTYCWGHVAGLHVHPNDLFIKRRYMKRIKALQYRRPLINVRGIAVKDAHTKRSSALMFSLPKPKISVLCPP